MPALRRWREAEHGFKCALDSQDCPPKIRKKKDERKRKKRERPGKHKEILDIGTLIEQTGVLCKIFEFFSPVQKYFKTKN